MKILDVNKAVTKLDEDMALLQRNLDFLDLLESSVDTAVNMEGAMTGEGGEAIIRNHAELQLPTIRTFRAHISNTIEKINKMKGYILDFEPSEDGVVTEDYWDTQMNRNLDKVEEATEQSKSSVDALAASVSHIMNLGKLNVDNVLNRVDSSRKFAGEVVDELYTLDADGVDLMREVQSEGVELKATVKNAVAWMNTGGLTMSGVNIQDVRGYFADTTLHTQAPVVNWSNDMYLNLESSSDPTLRQHMSILYTLAAIGAHPDAVATAANRLDDYLGRPVSQGIILQAVSSQYSVTDMYAMAFPLTAQATYLKQVREAMSPKDKGIDVSNASSAHEAAHMVNQGERGSGTDYFPGRKAGDVYAQTSEFEWGWSLDDTSMAADFTPVIGNIKSGIEAFTGVDPITGRKLETWERNLAMAAIIGGPVVKGVSRVAKGVKNADKVGDVASKSSKVDYSTKIDHKVTEIDQVNLPPFITETYSNGVYRTVRANEPVTVYRTFGYKAEAGGGYATTSPAANRISAKVDTALLPEWQNNRYYEAIIEVPKGEVLNIGKVAPQTTKSGNLLKGEADQILLPKDWPLEWIKEIRNVPGK